ncbi:MAG: glycosyltransferase family 4 protein [Anaerolineae bacterium]|nr:glycosyltransferase family 4 protein [Anaerolineae bacterium]
MGGVRTINTLIRKIDAHALYANTVRSSIYAAFAARLARTPLIWHMRDYWLSESKPRAERLDRLGKWFLLGTATTVIANSHSVAKNLPQSKKITVVHNSVELDKFSRTTTGTIFRAQHNIAENAYVVGMVARLRPWKGQTSFIRAMRQVANQNPKLIF